MQSEQQAKQPVRKPVPHPTELSKAYWEGARHGKLVLQQCARCDTLRHYPRLLCDLCYSAEVRLVEASGRGKVHSWTVAHHAFHPAFAADTPYALLTVDLDEGVRTLGRYGSTEALHIGLAVRISFERGREDVALPVFVVDDE